MMMMMMTTTTTATTAVMILPDLLQVLEMNIAAAEQGGEEQMTQLKVLAHVYTRVQEEVEKKIDPSVGLLHRLLAASHILRLTRSLVHLVFAAAMAACADIGHLNLDSKANRIDANSLDNSPPFVHLPHPPFHSHSLHHHDPNRLLRNTDAGIRANILEEFLKPLPEDERE